MAKSKAKISAAQRDKNAIELAKHLKKRGFLSKQTKLHSGKYISKAVLKKVSELQHVAALDYVGVKVSRNVAKAAKERGYIVANGMVVGPRSTQFRNRMARGELTGIRPVRGGFMEEVQLPHTVIDMYSLVEQLRDGIDTLKMPDEQFAFKFFGAESYRAFRDSSDLLEYLQHYKSIFAPGGSLKTEDLQEEFEALTIFRLHRADISFNLRSRDKRKKDRQAAGQTTHRRGKKSLSEKLASMTEDRANRIRKRMADKAQARRNALAADPIKREEYRAKARARAKASYENRKK